MAITHIEEWLALSQPGEKIIVIGAGSLGKMTIDCIINNGKHEMRNIAIIDDNTNIQGQRMLGIPIVGDTSSLKLLNVKQDISFIIAIADNRVRENIAKSNPNLNYTNIISEKAAISNFSSVGKGSIILPGTIVDPDVKIGSHVIVNKLSTIAHDVTLREFSQVSPGVNLGGYVEIGERSFVGLNASLLPFVKITSDVIIGSGAVVTKNIDVSPSVFVGNPAKILKRKSV